MKKKLLIGICALGIAAQTSATVITVSNNPNSPGQYTDLQAAADAASNGDTLLVAGSATSYGNLTVNDKEIHLVGVGYEPNKQFPLSTSVQNITLGVAGSGAHNSTIEGLLITGDVTIGGTASEPLQNITIKRCKREDGNWGISIGEVDGVFVYNNLLIKGYYGMSISNGFLSQVTVGRNIFIENNIITGGVSMYSTANAGAVIVRNNLFTLGPGGGGANVGVPGTVTTANYCTVANNIYASGAQQNISGSYGIFTHNLAFDNSNADFIASGTNSASNNLDDVDPMFVLYQSGVANYLTNDYHLQPGSPAIGAGLNGEDLGIYGGNYPWPDGGASGSGWMYKQEPQFPQVNQMTIQNPIVPVNGTLSVTSKGIVND